MFVLAVELHVRTSVVRFRALVQNTTHSFLLPSPLTFLSQDQNRQSDLMYSFRIIRTIDKLVVNYEWLDSSDLLGLPNSSPDGCEVEAERFHILSYLVKYNDVASQNMTNMAGALPCTTVSCGFTLQACFPPS